MTRTKEQRPTTSFDLERARDVEKAMSPLPWFVLEDAHGEMIIIRNPNHPIHIDNLAARGKRDEANTPDAIGITYMRENFSNLIAEIERLRPYEKVAADLAACGSYVGIGPGEGELPIPERVRRCVNRLKETQHEYEQKIISKDARIKKLEDALAEYQRLGKVMNGRLPCLTLHGDCGRCSAQTREVCGALEQIAGGKIEPGVKPRSWQITEDRVTAIDQGLRFLEWSNAKTGNVETKKRIAILKTMLEEASDEHGFER